MKTKTLLMSRAAALALFMKTKTLLMSGAVALALLISAVAFLSSGDSELCTSEFAQGAYESAFPYCEKACSKDDGGGCAGLGSLYGGGLGVKQDYQQAKTYFEKACSLNYDVGCNSLGMLYYNGYGVKQNKKVSKEYYVKQNKKVAKEYYGKACGLGFHEGCWKVNDILIQQKIKGEDD